jgi:hypothetical protein
VVEEELPASREAPDYADLLRAIFALEAAFLP